MDFNSIGFGKEASSFEDQCWISHSVGGNTSRQVVRHVLSGKSHGVFQGRVNIAQDSQKAHSEQLHQTLLLDSESVVDSEPQLWISADDVVATHGASVGSLSEEQIFYLMSRGLEAKEAQLLVSSGFLTSLIPDWVESDESRRIGSSLRASMEEIFK